MSAAIGRVFSPDDEVKGDTALVVLSDALWRRAFGADPSVVGRQVTLTTGDSRNRRPRSYLVLGVLGPTFKFTYPLERGSGGRMTWAAVEASPGRAIMFNGAVARLNPGGAVRGGGREDGRCGRPSESPRRCTGPAGGDPARAGLRVGGWRNPPIAAAVGWNSLILLVITCATVASALLVRLAGRQRELAVRSSLGASGYRLARQAIAEAFVISVSGTPQAWRSRLALLPAFRALVPSIVPRADELGITRGSSCSPQAPRCSPRRCQRSCRRCRPREKPTSSKHSSADPVRRRPIESTRRWRSALIAGRSAIATSLLVASVLLLLSFWRLGRVDLGFDGSRC